MTREARARALARVKDARKHPAPAHRKAILLLYQARQQPARARVHANGSLGDLLRCPKAETLPWEIGYKIAVGAATLCHTAHALRDSNICTMIAHRKSYIKTSSPTTFWWKDEAYLTDFGIARMVEPAASLDLSSVAGSVGYIPPEYSFGMRVTEKIDKYSFDVVLLELVTGKHAAEPLNCVKEPTWCNGFTIEWVVTPKGLCETLDSKCGTSSQNEMTQLLKIAMCCTNHMSASRPSMRQVVKLLADIAPRVRALHESRHYQGRRK